MDTSASLLESLRVAADEAAWETLCDLYSPLIRGWLTRLGAAPDDLDDLVQEVLVVVMRRVPDFRRERAGAFRSWLKTISGNCLRDHWRRKRKQGLTPGGSDFAELLAQLADPQSGLSKIWEQEYDKHVTQSLLQRIRHHFSEKTWTAFHRFTLEGASAETVAADLEMTTNAVFIAKSRVLAKLREYGRGLLD